MLVIRKPQCDALAASRIALFEDRMIAHHQQHFPAWSQARGGDGLRAFVHHGMARAGRHGFETELDIARYLHAMQALGDDFDESPVMPWATELLRRALPAAAKMALLRDAVDYELEARRIRHARYG